MLLASEFCKISKIRVKNREPVPSYRMDRNDDELDAIMSDGEGDSLENDTGPEDGVDHQASAYKRQEHIEGEMDPEMVHQALLRQAEAAAHMQSIMQSQMGLGNLGNLGSFAGFAGLPMGLTPSLDLHTKLQAQIQRLSAGNSSDSQQTNRIKESKEDSLHGSGSPSPPAVLGSATSLRSPPSLLPPASNPYLPAYSSALGGLTALTSGLAGGAASATHPPLTPSPSSDSPQQQDAPRAANSSQQSWTFEEQFKQLYELSDDLGRKQFLDDLFDFMQKRGTPITRLPIMAKQVLDLYELFNLVVARGGLVDVINKKLWQEIIKGLHLPSSITSAAFTLRTQYMKYLYPYECEKEKFSTPAELQAAIDGNRREGRRSSYGAYADLVPRPAPHHAASLNALASHMSHLSPLSLVSPRPSVNGNANHQRPGSQSPPSQSQQDALAALDMSRLHLWNLYSSLGDVGGDMAAAMAAASRFMPPTQSSAQPPQTEALNLAAEQHAAAMAAARAAESRDAKSKARRDEDREREREKRERDWDVIRVKEEACHPDPPPKKLLLDDDVSLNMSVTPLAVPGANIKITSRGGDGRSTDSSLVVSMEINGIVYQGVLFAQAAAAAAATSGSLTPGRSRLA